MISVIFPKNNKIQFFQITGATSGVPSDRIFTMERKVKQGLVLSANGYGEWELGKFFSEIDSADFGNGPICIFNS